MAEFPRIRNIFKKLLLLLLIDKENCQENYLINIKTHTTQSTIKSKLIQTQE